MYLTPRLLGGFPLQGGRADCLADTVGHLLHVVTQVGGNLPDLQAVECRRGRPPIDRAAAAAAAGDAGDRTSDAAASALQQLPVLLGQRAQPLLVRGRNGGWRVLLLNLMASRRRHVCAGATHPQGGAPVLGPLWLSGLPAPPSVLRASHRRGAVVHPDAGAVWSSVAPLDRLQMQI